MLTFYIVVAMAYQVLSDSEKRKEYNRNRKEYKLRGELDPIALWDEKFAENASGTDSGSESDGDDSEEEEMKPGEKWVQIYQRATPFVRDLLANPESSKVKDEIKELNKEIEQLNQEHNRHVKKLKDNERRGHLAARYVKKDAFLISFNVLKFIGIQAILAVASLKEDPSNKQAKKVQKDLET